MERDTVEIYEQHAQSWRDRRPPTGQDRAVAFAARVAAAREADIAGGARAQHIVDVGCGPAPHVDALASHGAPVVALDAARAMLDLARAAAPSALLLQADLELLPFRRGSLGGAWASRTYVHLPRHRVPLALADLHGALAVGARVELQVFGGDMEAGSFPGDDFPGRLFSLWPEQRLADVVTGAGFTVDRLDAVTGPNGNVALHVRGTRARTLADTVAAGMRLLVCGLNPSVYSADAGVGYARPGNRFWPAAVDAGIVSRPLDTRHALVAHGVGVTDVVKRATVAAAELATEEYRAGMTRVERLCAWLQPGAVCFVGLAGWRAAVDRAAAPGVQDRRLGGVPVYVMPSTSGLNAHTRPADHVAHLRAAAALADGEAGPRSA